MTPRVRLRALLHSCAIALTTLASVSAAAHAQPPAQARPGAELTVFLTTYGQGDQVWEKFGHNAIWIHDGATGSTISYNYGMFNFDQDNFYLRLMKGSMLYTMWVNDAQAEVSDYTATNRTITTQRLNLTPEQRHALREFLEWNWLPGNREYLYDYFRDNCSTRLRDALDLALGGALRETLVGVPTGTTYRSQSLRLTAASIPVYTGLMIGLGMPTDQPIDAWQESFIPMELMRHLRSVNVTDANGNIVPLVAEEMVLHESTRPAGADAAPRRIIGYFFAGLILAAAVVALALAAARRRRRTPLARVGLAGALTVWGVTAGLFGVILSLLWIATDHDAAYPNLNLLLLNPLALVLAVAAPLALGQRRTGSTAHATARLATPLAFLLAGLALIALVVRLLPIMHQANGELIGLLLPVHFAVAFSLYHHSRAHTSPPEDALATEPPRGAV